MQFSKQSHQSLQLSPSLSDLLNMQAFARIAKVDAGGFVLKTLLLLPLSFNFSFYTKCFDKVLNDKTGEILYEANKNNQKTWLVIVELITE